VNLFVREMLWRNAVRYLPLPKNFCVRISLFRELPRQLISLFRELPLLAILLDGEVCHRVKRTSLSVKKSKNFLIALFLFFFFFLISLRGNVSFSESKTFCMCRINYFYWQIQCCLKLCEQTEVSARLGWPQFISLLRFGFVSRRGAEHAAENPLEVSQWRHHLAPPGRRPIFKNLLLQLLEIIQDDIYWEFGLQPVE